ncbi:hypothetical protein AB0F03_32515 [Streptomyces sp. NPDC028722]|uniref:hypothetical protein n=1 Tax=unclassified Streptomyces TaxID=2593676 RepID=UPI0033F0BC08
MQFTSKARKAALTLGAVSCLTAGTVAATAGPAAAATAHTFKVCAQGNYSAYGELPQQGGFSTVLITPGKCATLPLAAGTTYAKVRGVYNTNPSKSFYVGTAHFTASKGYTGAAKGTATSPYLVNLG